MYAGLQKKLQFVVFIDFVARIDVRDRWMAVANSGKNNWGWIFLGFHAHMLKDLT